MNRTAYVCIVCFALFVLMLAFAETSLGEDPTDRAREALGNDILRIAKRAQEYYRRPWEENGGGGSFVGLTADAWGMRRLVAPNTAPFNLNGTFAITTAGTATTLSLTGTGAFMGTNGSTISITAHVFPDSIYLNYTN